MAMNNGGIYGWKSAMTPQKNKVNQSTTVNQSMANQSFARQPSVAVASGVAPKSQASSVPDVPKATLYKPGEAPQVVLVGSPEASYWQSQGYGLTDPTKKPDIPKQMDDGNIGNSGVVKVSEDPVPSNSVDAYDANQKAVMELMSGADNQVVEDKTSEVDLRSKRIDDIINSLEKKGETRQELYQQAGVNLKQDELSSINKQYNSIKAEYDRLISQNANRNIQSSIIGGTRSKLELEKSQKLGDLATKALAIQGDIAAAKSNADMVINDKYDALVQELDLRREQLSDARESLSAEDKKRADKELLLIEARQKDIAQQKENEKSISNLLIDAASAGVSQEVLDKINIAGSYADAARIVAPHLGINPDTDIPKKIGTSGDEDLFFYNGEVVTGSQLLGTISGNGDYNYANDAFSAEVNDPVAYDWATSIRDGKAKFSDITGDPKLKSRVNSVLRTLPPSEAAINDAEKMIADLRALYDPDTGKAHPGLNSAVGSNVLGRIPLSDFVSGQKDNFMAIANKVISKQALDSLIESKSQGATFGALSDTEMQILKAAKNSIASREKRTGFDVSQDFFKNEIKKFINDYQSIINKSKDPFKIGEDEDAPGGKSDKLTIFGKLKKYKDGEWGGQCGKFVNDLTGIGLGNSYESKLAKMDWVARSGKPMNVEPGMVFVSPYDWTGHAGIITGVNNDGTVTVRDSNYSRNNDELVRTRVMPISKITGLARV